VSFHHTCGVDRRFFSHGNLLGNPKTLTILKKFLDSPFHRQELGIVEVLDGRLTFK
jgi:hypothetical protein